MKTYEEGFKDGHSVGLNRVRNKIIGSYIYDPMEILRIIDKELQRVE